MIVAKHMRMPRPVFHLFFYLAVACSAGSFTMAPSVFAEETAPSPTATQAPPQKYHTPLAGEAQTVTFLGQTIALPAIDRSHITSLTLGGTFLFPSQGSTDGSPMFALFIKRDYEDYRTRDVISVLYNELEYDKRFGDFELVGHFENYTLPYSIKEIQDNKEMKQTAVSWGNLMASFGPGVSYKVSPYKVDNDLKFQLLGRVGYMYAEEGHDKGPSVVVPPSTMLWGARLRGRYDGITRNLLELPHRGLAVGFDLDYTHRNNWRDLSPTGTGSVNRDFLQFRGYLTGAGGIPGLSERNRLLLRISGGTTDNADRFNAFTINGGPFPSESDDLVRNYYTGILYDDIRATNYATASLGYRRELAFFIYASLFGSYMWADRATVQGVGQRADNVVFRGRDGASGTFAIDSGGPWNSSLYLAYSWESDLIRNGRSGSGVILTWNKLF